MDIHDILMWFYGLDPDQPEVLLSFLNAIKKGLSTGWKSTKEALFGEKPKMPGAEETKNDDALAAISRGQFDRHKSKFAPLTNRLDTLSQQDKSSTLRGRGNADVMQSLGSARAPGSNGQMGSAQRVGTRGLGTALSGGSEQARERSNRLTKGVMNAATGSGQEAIRGLGFATQLTTGESIRKMTDDFLDSQQTSNMIGAALGAGGAMAMNSSGGGTPTEYGTSARTAYNVNTGKGGMGSGGFVSNSRYSGQRYLGAQGF